MKTKDLTGYRVVAVHAHPDDETLFMGGTLATLAARGAEVTVITLTLGEDGEVIGEPYRHWPIMISSAAFALANWPMPSMPWVSKASNWEVSAISMTPAWQALPRTKTRARWSIASRRRPIS